MKLIATSILLAGTIANAQGFNCGANSLTSEGVFKADLGSQHLVLSDAPSKVISIAGVDYYAFLSPVTGSSRGAQILSLVVYRGNQIMQKVETNSGSDITFSDYGAQVLVYCNADQ